MIDLSKKIIESVKTRDKIATATYKEIKTLRSLWETSEANLGKTYSDEEELKILRTIEKQHQDALKYSKDLGRESLIEEETKILEFLKGLLPKEATEEDIRKALVGKENLDFGSTMSYLKRVFPETSGKTLSGIVKKIKEES